MRKNQKKSKDSIKAAKGKKKTEEKDEQNEEKSSILFIEEDKKEEEEDELKKDPSVWFMVNDPSNLESQVYENPSKKSITTSKSALSVRSGSEWTEKESGTGTESRFESYFVFGSDDSVSEPSMKPASEENMNKYDRNRKKRSIMSLKTHVDAVRKKKGYQLERTESLFQFSPPPEDIAEMSEGSHKKEKSTDNVFFFDFRKKVKEFKIQKNFSTPEELQIHKQGIVVGPIRICQTIYAVLELLALSFSVAQNSSVCI